MIDSSLNIQFEELDVSKIVAVPSDTEVPVHNNYGQTQRSLCTNSPQNKEILNNLQAVFNQIDPVECSSDLFKDDYQTIDKIEELKKALSEVLIRFNTSPKNYTKSDYGFLLYTLSSALLTLYTTVDTLEPPRIKLNNRAVATKENDFNLNIETDEHLSTEEIEAGIKISANVGEMNNSDSTGIATVNDIRNYIENRLAWQVVNL